MADAVQHEAVWGGGLFIYSQNTAHWQFLQDLYFTTDTAELLFSIIIASWFLLLCRIHFPWLSRTKWIIFPD